VKDREVVISIAAIDRGRATDTIREPPAGDFERRENIFGRDTCNQFVAGILDAFGAEHLTNLQAVVADAEIDRRSGNHVVRNDIVIAAERVHDQTFKRPIVETFDCGS